MQSHRELNSPLLPLPLQCFHFYFCCYCGYYYYYKCYQYCYNSYYYYHCHYYYSMYTTATTTTTLWCKGKSTWFIIPGFGVWVLLSSLKNVHLNSIWCVDINMYAHRLRHTCAALFGSVAKRLKHATSSPSTARSWVQILSVCEAMSISAFISAFAAGNAFPSSNSLIRCRNVSGNGRRSWEKVCVGDWEARKVIFFKKCIYFFFPSPYMLFLVRVTDAII